MSNDHSDDTTEGDEQEVKPTSSTPWLSELMDDIAHAHGWIAMPPPGEKTTCGESAANSQ